MARKRLKKPGIRPARIPWTEAMTACVGETLGLTPLTHARLERLAETVKHLSDRFLTIAGGTAPEPPSPENADEPYTETRDFLQAYVRYYLPANVPKIADTLLCSGVIDALQPDPETGGLRVLDLGTGPGTSLIGLLLAMAQAGRTEPVSITATDRSPVFLDAAAALVQAFRKYTGIHGNNRFMQQALPNAPDEPFDAVFMTNVLAETAGTLADKLPELLENLVAPGGIALLLEPAQRRVARALHAVRNAMEKETWRIVYPCPGNYPCPALARNRDWCHHRLAWDPPETIRRVDRYTRMHKQFLNFTPLVLERRREPSWSAKQSTEPAGAAPTATGESMARSSVVRVISDMRILKGKLEVLVCGDFGDENHLRIVMLENKKVSRYNEVFPDLTRYDRVRMENVEIRGDRLILSETSRLTRVVDDGDRE